MTTSGADFRASDDCISKALQLFDKLGPSIVTGGSDDDRSGVATYSQVGAQFGFAMILTILFSYPLTAGTQQSPCWLDDPGMFSVLLQARTKDNPKVMTVTDANPRRLSLCTAPRK